MRARMGWLVWVAATTLGCAEPPAAPTAPELPSDPWSTRIARERTMAQDDPRYAPRLDGGQIVLDAPGGLTAAFGGVGTRIRIGTRDATLAVSALGRSGTPRAPLAAPGTPIASGPEVRSNRGGGVIEWWRALPSGLEHGVTIAERPPGEGEVEVEVAIGGTVGTAEASDDAVALVSQTGERLALYAHLFVRDDAGATLPSRMSVERGRIVLAFDDAGARYPVVVDPLLIGEEATLYAPDGIADDRFGYSVALSADGSRAIVGAYLDDDTARGTNCGSARVFLRTGTTWTQEATLLAADGALGDSLGYSVALSADGAYAIVGAPTDDTPGGVDAGSARIFVRSGTSWTEEATLLAPDGQLTDAFGRSVALSSDASLALVGVEADDTPGGANAGSARVFVRSGTSWAQQAVLLAPDGAADDVLGGSVALAADGSRALLGAYADDTAAGTNAGSARVFVRSGTSWAHEQALVAGDGAASDFFGSSVALSADGSRALVGAQYDDTTTGMDAGSARVFVRAGTSWTEETTLVPPDGVSFDRLGYAVAFSSDGSRALAGAPYDDTAAGMDVGSARLFVRTGTSWAVDTGLLASDGLPPDLFGASVALSSAGDRALVGAYNDNRPPDTRTGSTRVFTLLPSSGGACGVDGDCPTGFCTDGVCCSTRCAGGSTDCQACAAALTGGADGACAPLSTAVAPTVTCRGSTDACDAAETCSSASAVCPADVLAPATTVCRIAGGGCDVAERCTGTSAVCPADALVPTGTVCRPGTSACDGAETCDGSTAACPPQLPAAAGTPCRVSTGICDAAEVCDGASFACPGDAVAPAGVVCRSVGGACDVEERCTGTSTACPSDTFLPSSDVCRPGVGTCDATERCTGTSASCPPDGFMPSSTTCGPAPSGPCDAPDQCSGVSTACVTTYLAGVECRPAVGSCDLAETCSGTTTACPPDGVRGGSIACRPTAGPCDLPESCNGVDGACPMDVLRPPGTPCGASSLGVCDADDACDGSTPACAPAFAPAGTSCRSATSPCDAPETCTGASPTCPVDGFLPASTICDASVGGACDVPDHCAGTSATCVVELVSVGTICRASTGTCDVPEACTGTSDACPADAVLASTTECRVSAGPCDVAERCTGAAGACPADARADSSTACRASGGDCDLVERCDGASVGCPGDVVAPPGAVCRPATGSCDVAETCDGISLECPLDGTACDAGLVDGGVTTRDAGERDAGPADASTPADAGPLDSGADLDAAGTPITTGGCACRAAPRPSAPGPCAVAAAFVVALAIRRWRPGLRARTSRS